jgi:hypothetical protein
MRTILILAAVSSCLGLAACQPSKDQATEAPAAPKSLSRPAQLYAGQGEILSVQAASVAPGKTEGSLTLKASGKAASAGYYDLAFLPRINAAPPSDGVYDVDIIGYMPQGAAAQVVTPVEASGEWTNYPKARLKGVRFNAKTNAVVAMLPAG